MTFWIVSIAYAQLLSIMPHYPQRLYLQSQKKLCMMWIIWHNISYVSFGHRQDFCEKRWQILSPTAGLVSQIYPLLLDSLSSAGLLISEPSSIPFCLAKDNFGTCALSTCVLLHYFLFGVSVQINGRLCSVHVQLWGIF